LTAGGFRLLSVWQLNFTSIPRRKSMKKAAKAQKPVQDKKVMKKNALIVKSNVKAGRIRWS
jgi:hypothetical protein